MYKSEPGNTENILLADSAPDAERILFNGRQQNLEFALHCDDFFMDGTLKIASCLFKHIIIIVII